jgi:hypothetical protein
VNAVSLGCRLARSRSTAGMDVSITCIKLPWSPWHDPDRLIQISRTSSRSPHLLGPMSVLLRWLLDLEPFAHILRAGSGRFSPAPLWWLLAIDVAVIVRG